MKRIKHETEEIDIEVLTDLETMTALEYKELLTRKALYLRYKEETGLSDKSWCYVLKIQAVTDVMYSRGDGRVPDYILNRAAIAKSAVTRLLKKLRAKN